MEYPERVWFLIARNLTGEASEPENEELMQILQQQPQVQQQYNLLKNLWNGGDNQEQDKIDPARISHILQLSAVEDALIEDDALPSIQSPPIPKRRKIYRWAAILIGIIVLALASKWIISVLPGRSHAIVAQKGSKTRTILPDGSRVWINAGSKIVYEANFNKALRQVTLYGEAYFDVVKDADKPFIVHAGDINIEVLGTVFNVKSYPEDKTIETTLLKGLVQITTAHQPQSPIYLRPNQKIILPQYAAQVKRPTLTATEEKTPKNMNIPGITNLDSSLEENERMETAWIYNRLEFRGDTFRELARKLERWYNISIHFEDEKVKELTFNGSLENETVEQAFRALHEANSFDFKIKDNEIFIRSSLTN